MLELLWRELLAYVVHDPIGPHQPAVETQKRPVDVSKERQRIEAIRARGLSPGPVFGNDPWAELGRSPEVQFFDLASF